MKKANITREDEIENYCLSCNANCCRNWTIFCTIADVERIKEGTGLEYNEFCSFDTIPKKELDYYKPMSDFHMYHFLSDGKLLQLKKKENGDCIFLKEDGSCGNHKYRPTICAFFPLWFVEKDDNYELKIDIGYEGVCIIPSDELLKYIETSKSRYIELSKQYYNEIMDYMSQIDKFVIENQI